MTGQVPPVAAGAVQPPDPRLRTAREFEAVFAAQLTQLLLAQVEIDPAFGGGHGEEQFRGILAEELGRAIAAGGSLGLAPAILAQIQRIEDSQ